MVHGVGAVTDDDALDPVFDLLPDFLSQGSPLHRAHIFGENAKEFQGFQVADIGQFRDSTV